MLVVDDDRDVRAAVRRHLEQDGYAVCEAETGDGALAWIAAHGLPGAVILDLQMPGRTGEETLLAIRARCRQTVVVIASGALDGPRRAALLAQGASACLDKPEIGERLVPLLERLLGAGVTAQ